MPTRNTHLLKRRDGDDPLRDCHFTRYGDVADEMQHYHHLLEGKSIHCPCDSHESAFYKYFRDHYRAIGLTGLTATCWNDTKPGGFVSFDGDDERRDCLQGNGDCLSREVLEISDRSDVIITNPPFSIIGDIVTQYLGMDADFILLVPPSAFTQKAVRHELPTRKVMPGVNYDRNFIFDRPDGSTSRIGCMWMVTLDHGQRKPPLELTCKYDPTIHRTYDNIDAIDAPSYLQIPSDYYGLIGVPVTFLYFWCHDQFEVLGANRAMCQGDLKIDGKLVFTRLFIRRKQHNQSNDAPQSASLLTEE